MKKKRKMSPQDYPIFAFRLSKEDKTKLNGLIKELHKSENRNLDQGLRKTKRNEIIVKAMFKGLNALKRSGLAATTVRNGSNL